MLHRLIGHSEDRLVQSWRSHFEALIPEIVAFERAAELLRSMRASGLQVVIATSSPQDLLRTLLALVGPDDLTDIVVSGSDVERAKPQPDIFEVAIRKTGLERSQVLALGDSEWDIEGARRAGIGCVGLECGGTSRLELEHAGAVAVFRDPADLLWSFGRSPFPRLGS
jgi:HAD superfamily hydrolase (TIGR01509 family)